MITREQIPQVVGHPVHDATGKRIGDAKHMYLDDATGDPEWVTVRTGFFGNSETFVPTRSAQLVQDHLEIPYDKDQIKGAPTVDVDSGGHLSAEEERHLYVYYGLESRGTTPPRTDKAAGTAPPAAGAAAPAAGAAGEAGSGGGQGTSERNADPGAEKAAGMAGSEAGVGTGTGSASYAAGPTGAAERLGPDMAAGESESMIRSEEEMLVNVERRAAGRARLHKYVDVEEVEETIPVRREDVRLEREPITEADRSAVPGSEITEDEQFVTLHEEQAVIDTRVVPKERVRMRVEEHVEQKTVHGRVRKERIETDTMGSAEAKGTRETGQEPGDERFR